MAAKRVILTGSTSGIGEAAFRHLAAEGMQVIGLARSNEIGMAQLEALRANGCDKLDFIRCDVSKRVEVEQAFQEAADTMGGIDAVVHLAAIEKACPAESTPDEVWDLLLDINGRGTMIVNQAAFPYLREEGGCIVNFASSAGVIGMPGSAAYAASKGAVLAWTRTIAREWGKYNITANAVAPNIWTPMYDNWRNQLSPESLDAHDAKKRETIPLGGRYGDPDRDMAPVIAFLVSDGARFITGQTISVDGGQLLMR